MRALTTVRRLGLQADSWDAARDAVRERLTEQELLDLPGVEEAIEAGIEAVYGQEIRRRAERLRTVWETAIERIEAGHECKAGPDGLCTVCGVDHSDPCPACGQTGHHAADCPDMMGGQGS